MTDPAPTFRAYFAIRPATAKVLARLYAAGGEIVGHEELASAGGQTCKGLYESIKFLRQAMDPGSVANKPNVGFRLTEVGVADCDGAIADAVGRELAA